MRTFSAKTSAEAVVPHPPEAIWAVLVDPDLVARFTPFVKQITADGEHWIWELSGIKVLGAGFAPVFTERMTLEEPKRIEFTHEPAEGASERAGVHGWYDLEDLGDEGTRLATSLEICVELPLPRAAGPAVRGTMQGVMATMGARFSKNLLRHLDRG